MNCRNRDAQRTGTVNVVDNVGAEELPFPTHDAQLVDAESGKEPENPLRR